MASDTSIVEEIRSASRSIARDWGFMGGAFAGSDLSPSAVHALIEIDKGGLDARDLAARLRLEKSSVSRMLRKLVERGDIVETARPEDKRVKCLTLSPAGRQRLASIDAYARNQVGTALRRLKPGEDGAVLAGLRLYAHSLAAASDPAPALAGDVALLEGYRPGLIGRITQMHARYYSGACGFGQRFESVVAAGLAGFCDRLENGRNRIWTAVRGGEILGSVAIDGEDLGAGIAHLRWFIVDDGLRGAGVGRRLLAGALAFCDAHDFRETRLWTFSGLDVARKLYEDHGFVCTEERRGSQWGTEVLEQQFTRLRASREQPIR